MMFEITIGDNSKLAGEKLADADSYLDQFGVLIGMVRYNGTITIPNGDFVLEAGQKIYVMGTKTDVDKFYKAEIPENIRVKDVLIIGASTLDHKLTG